MLQPRTRVHLLTAGFSSPNGRAFLMPLIVHRRIIQDAGIALRIFLSRGEGLTDCDVLIVDNKFHSSRWARESDGVLAELATLKQRVRRLIYFDILDSTAWDHTRALPCATLYCKAQLLRDRTAYLKPFYGYRPYSDYYHRTCGVEDDEPVWSEPLPDAALLDRMTVGWNSGLGDYSWFGPYRMAAYRRLPLKPLLRFPDAFHPASVRRAKGVSCRIGTRYSRRSVAYQRQQMARVLAHRLDTSKLSRRRYLAELRASMLAVSPFGLGEITLRDFEVFMAGAALVKPDMSGIETWPDLYRDGESMIAHRWDLADLEEKIESALADPTRTVEIAAEGQARYRRHVAGPEAGRLFVEHFMGILSQCDRLAA